MAQVDITAVAQELIDGLRAESEDLNAMIRGVVLLHDALKDVINSTREGEEDGQDSQSRRASEEASETEQETEPKSRN